LMLSSFRDCRVWFATPNETRHMSKKGISHDEPPWCSL